MSDIENKPGEVSNQTPSKSKKAMVKKLIAWIGGISGAVLTAYFVAVGTGLGDRLSKSIDGYDVHALTDRDAIISLNPQISNYGGEYLFSEPIQQIGSPPSGTNTCDGRHQWAKQHNGVDVEITVGRISVSAAEGNQVTIIGAKPLVIGERQFPAVGSIASCPGRGGGPRILGINLDTGKASFADNVDDPASENFTAIPVPAGSTYDFDFVATTQQHRWSYRIQLVLNVNGEIVTREVDDDGRPFQTTARSNGRSYQWVDGQWQDVTPGGDSDNQASTGVPPNPRDNQNPCKIVSSMDVASELGSPVQVMLFGGPAPGTSGYPITAYTCVHNAKNGDMIQVDYVEANNAQQARAEFEKQLLLRDTKRTARDVPGYGGTAKLVDNSSLAILRGIKFLIISRTLAPGASSDDNAALLGRLAMTGVGRLDK